MIAAYPMPPRTMLFDIPIQAAAHRRKERAKPKAKPRSLYTQGRLWLASEFDAAASPAPGARKIPSAAREHRSQMRSAFDASRIGLIPYSARNHEKGQQLLPLIRRVSYTQELADGAFRVFVEYRACDKFPHYRLTWGHLFWGRVDIRLDTDTHGADILSSPALPFVQSRLADYLIALGYRLDTAHLQPHEMDFEDEYESDVLLDEDIKTDTREYRIFKINVEKERKRAAALAARTANTA